ncbi:allophanate hydrolase [Tsukamurella pulmonis]|uniref:ChrR Cupin-like domain-containing protein n=1 Tax=Tsukamurella pulmonis TaxID=47312 RepID=A0A1H1H4E1_9ACTN|nr:cupin domain-containing protein [Tsukamurella pulmonis]KXO88373.1 allophanate hydrolase [Tsukamurella pulmonis]SDR20294.1 ChrR Cupin-like domain-containing protein [Tsukamurella pulmonis]SUP15981.1 anti-sigma factor, putative, ChrR family [Tsukamurella pulmonis]
MADIEVINNVFRSGFEMTELDWGKWQEPGRVGVDRYPLWVPSAQETSVGMLVRYPAGAHGDYHEHLGYELMLVLEGTLEHSNGQTFVAGDLIVEEPGTFHRMATVEGATILAIRTKPADPRPEDAPEVPTEILEAQR